MNEKINKIHRVAKEERVGRVPHNLRREKRSSWIVKRNALDEGEGMDKAYLKEFGRLGFQSRQEEMIRFLENQEMILYLEVKVMICSMEEVI